MSEHSKIIEENKKRLDRLFAPYDPLTGLGSPLERFSLTYYIEKDKPLTVFLPISMRDEPAVIALQKTPDISELAKITFAGKINGVDLFMQYFTEVRFKHDFEFWAFLTLKIQDKKTFKDVPFRMRLAQRLYFHDLEQMRLAGLPIRIILLKARQWGGSTLTQMYMLWIQIVHKVNWHSAICADVEDQAKNVRGMYHRAAATYPDEVGKITLAPYEKSGKNRMVQERGCIIGIGSMQEPENLRSYNFAMLHLTEVGSWKETQMKKPEDLTQTLRGMLVDEPYTLEVLESTAKGVGNFFHREWLAAKNKKSGYKAVFMPWFMIDLYLKPIEDYEAFIKSMTDYDRVQWEQGATLEGINWYRTHKAAKNYDDWRMQAEFPGTDLEAFAATGSRVFAPEYVSMMRKYEMDPEYKGQLFAKGRKGKEAFIDLEFKPTPEGELWIWALPDKTIAVKNRYIVAVDIGGRTDDADFSTVRVLDRYFSIDGGPAEFVATWHGHLDQDIFAWVAVQIAAFYNNALFIVESNSLRKDTVASEGDHYLTILDQIAEHYDNVFTRVSPEKVKGNPPVLYGLHMGQNKTLVIDAQNAAMREQSTIERDRRVNDECDTYENKPDGTMGAVSGCHDDLVIPSAICNWAHTNPQAIGPCKEVDESRTVKPKTITSEATF